MNGVGDYLLSHAGLSQEQHGALEGGHLPDHLHHLPQAEIGADNIIFRNISQLPGEVLIFRVQDILQLGQLPVAQGVGDGDDKRFPQLGDEVGMLSFEHPPAVRQKDDRSQSFSFNHQTDVHHGGHGQIYMVIEDPTGRVQFQAIENLDLLPGGGVIVDPADRLLRKGFGAKGFTDPVQTHPGQIVNQPRDGIEDDQQHLPGGQIIPQIGETVEHLLFYFQTAAEPDGGLPEKFVS